MIRLFVALKIPNSVIKQITEIRKKINSEEKYNWEKEEKIHLTLKFIGNVQDDKLNPISEELKFIENYEKLSFSLTHFGFFFKNSKPKILWAGLSENQNIIKLAEEINNKLKKFDISPDERKFKSHLTLLRIKNKVSKNFIEQFNNYKIPEINFLSEEVSLIKSRLLSKGSVYTKIKKYKLK